LEKNLKKINSKNSKASNKFPLNIPTKASQVKKIILVYLKILDHKKQTSLP